MAFVKKSDIILKLFLPTEAVSHNSDTDAFYDEMGIYFESTYKFGKTELDVEMIFYFPNKATGDIDNLIKTILDCFQRSGILKNDRHVKELHVRIEEYAPTPGISIAVRKFKKTAAIF